MVANTYSDDDSSELMTDMWTSLKVSDPAVTNLKNTIRATIPDDWEGEPDTHISVMPGFEVPTANVDEVTEELEETIEAWKGEKITVTGFDCFHALNDDEPTFVISLDVDVELGDLREHQQEIIEDAGGELHFDPVNPHITLFKQGDGGDEHRPLTEDEREDIRAALDEATTPNPVLITDVRVETY